MAAVAASVLAGMVTTGGTALAATATPAFHNQTSVTDRGGWDHRGHNGFDRGGWRGRNWDHRGSGWNWEQQCDWAYYHDRGWWYDNCS